MSYNADLDTILSLASRASPSSSSSSYQHHAASSSSYAAASSSLCSSDNPHNCQASEQAPALPLSQYRLNEDPYPEIIRKKPADRVHYTQNVAVRYLKPPAPAPAGDIVIQQLPDRQVAPAPALHVSQQQPSRPNPAPLIIREAPPQAPAPIPGEFHQIPGKIIPPPARKVITEFLPPCPPKPQQIIIDRWLPYEQPQQRVVYQPAKPACIIPDPKNVHIIWSEPDVDITQCYVDLGVHNANPAEYIARHGSSLVRSECLPEIANRFSSRACHVLAANHRAPVQPVLYGDVQYLSLINRSQC